MASTIAAVTTGGGGVITTADSSGNLSLLSGATTVVAVTATGATVTGTLAATGASTFTGTGKFATTIGVGNATPSASGSGITFPATQSASSDANTLDDYEEGTWTPTFTGATSGTVPATGLSGTYTKIGRQVHARISIVNPTTTVLVGAWRIGLPFPVKLQSGEYMGGYVTYNRNISTAGTWFSFYVSTDGVSFVNIVGNYANGTESVSSGGTVPVSMLFSGELIYTTTS